jgi:hypothetical protein
MASPWLARAEYEWFPFRASQQGGIVAAFAVMERLERTQINLLRQRGFFHKIDLIVRFRLAGVRIRGHEEG